MQCIFIYSLMDPRGFWVTIPARQELCRWHTSHVILEPPNAKTCSKWLFQHHLSPFMVGVTFAYRLRRNIFHAMLMPWQMRQGAWYAASSVHHSGALSTTGTWIRALQYANRTHCKKALAWNPDCSVRVSHLAPQKKSPSMNYQPLPSWQDST